TVQQGLTYSSGAKRNGVELYGVGMKKRTGRYRSDSVCGGTRYRGSENPIVSVVAIRRVSTN
ncbi:hypothetical protein, partial [Streptomyces sp. NPDC058621]|uniref:hypothetical protein n=1 Tax=Streptomyces sp. NPDC058621 TaxID=3346561 RepID=UPI003656E94E